MTIGLKLPPETLVLTRGRDFRWAFQNLDANLDPEDFPAGDLYFELATGETPTEWHFTIVDDLASLKVESDDSDLIPTQTKFQLVWMPDGEAEGGEVVALGKVLVQGAA
jgi:hypothetical protein